MLSIGKVAVGTGGGRYYVEAVAKGAEDYYLGAGEAPGEWIGRGARDLELEGLVSSEDFLALMTGTHPTTGDQLGRAGGTVAAFDATFSAPKSVSVLYALGSGEVSLHARQAHDAAVKAALGYLEVEASSTRRGAGGVERMETSGLIAGAFRHRTSRACDPQLHTHVVIANRVLGKDGKWSRLDGRALYAHAKTAGYLYQAHLRHELSERLGVEWGPVRNGQAELAGVPEELCRAFSKRRVEITARMVERGDTTAAGAQAATLDTRRAKGAAPRFTEAHLAAHDAQDYSVKGDGPLEARWRQEAADLGFGPRAMAEVLDRTPSQTVTPDLLIEQLVSPEGLTAQASTFSRRDVLQALAAGLPAGATVSRVLRLEEETLDRPEVVRLIGLPEVDTSLRAGDVIRRADGVVVGAGTDLARYSTGELVEAERMLITGAVAGQGAGVGVATTSAVADAIEVRPTLGEDQRAMIEAITSSGDRIEVVVGRAGTGKTYALATAREAWQNSGFEVIGAALAARAARQLESDAAIPSGTLARRLFDLDTGRLVLENNSVVVLDEAGMVGTRQMTRLAAHVAQAEAKLVLVGDYRQLPEIDAGGAFRGLRNRLAAVELRDNRRQEHEWERTALDELRHGDVANAVTAYDSHGRVTVSATKAERLDVMVENWWETRTQGKEVLLLAGRRTDVAALNRAAQERRLAAGELGEVVATVGNQEIRVGDRAMILRNDHRLGLDNGQRVTVVGVASNGLRLELDNHRHVELTPDALTDARIGLGYASTIHKAQGATADVALCLGDDKLFRQLTYTAASRGRQENRFYLVAGDQSWRSEAESRVAAVARLSTTVNRSKAKSMATELGNGVPEKLLNKELGPRPKQGAALREWDRQAAAVARYREVYEVTDTKRLLGPRPADLEQQMVRAQLQRRLDLYQQRYQQQSQSYGMSY